MRVLLLIAFGGSLIAGIYLYLDSAGLLSNGLSEDPDAVFPAVGAGTERRPPAATGPLPAVSDVPRSSTSWSVEGAYRAIPHKRTVFRGSTASMAAEEEAYLRLMFEVIEQAIVLRVSLLESLSRGSNDVGDQISSLDTLRAFIVDRVSPPPPLVGYHGDIVSALGRQHRFFDEWQKQGARFPYAGRQLSRHAAVQASSAALKRAYNRLMQRYSGESAHNKAAFFDYHCALDFL